MDCPEFGSNYMPDDGHGLKQFNDNDAIYIQDVHNVFEKFEIIMEKGVLRHSVISIRLIKEVLRTFDADIILFNRSAVCSYDVSNAGIHFFTPFQTFQFSYLLSLV